MLFDSCDALATCPTQSILGHVKPEPVIAAILTDDTRSASGLQETKRESEVLDTNVGIWFN